jgi:hypothetical protein
MNAPVRTHPGDSDLRRFGSGQMSADEAEGVEAHVSGCPDCCRVLKGLADDSLVELLRSAVNAAPARPGTTGGPPAAGPADSTTPATLPATPAVAAVPPELGDHPRYRVRELLGRGGMGAVYKAEHRLMERTVALKIIDRDLTARPETGERFRREVKAAARLSHPSIVQAFDAEQAGDTHFLVMEFVDGTNLGNLLAGRGALPVAEACDYARQAALGLQYAHEHGMVHRDIKPHNLMRTPDGRIKILDFGLARFVREQPPPTEASPPPGPEEPNLTWAGAFMGTADYVAPEQARDPHGADIRADVYSLGCTLYHHLTGRVPFPAAGREGKVVMHAAEQPAALAHLRPDLPAGLEAVVAKMMAKRPGDRYSTPGEVAAALEPFAKPGPADRSDTTAAPAGGSPGRPRRRLLVAALAALAFLGVTLAGLAVYRIRTDTGELVLTTESDDVEVVIKQDGKLVRIIDTKTDRRITLALRSGSYELALDGGARGLELDVDRATLRRGDVVLAHVRVTKPPAGPREDPPPPLRKASPARVLHPPGRCIATHVAISPDGARVVAGHGDARVRVWDVRTGRLEWSLAGHPDVIWTVAVSPNSRYALSGGQDNVTKKDFALRLWDLTTGKEVRQLAGHKSIVGWVAFLDNRRAVSASWDGTVRLWDSEAGKELACWRQNTVALGVAPTPDGRRAVLAGLDGSVRVISLADGKPVKEPGWHVARVESVAVSPDGALAASGSHDKTIVVWDLKEGRTVSRLRGHQALVAGLAFLPDGRRLISSSEDGTVRLWDVRRGEEVMRFEGHLPKICGVAVGPQGDFAVSAGLDDGSVLVWDLPK